MKKKIINILLLAALFIVPTLFLNGTNRVAGQSSLTSETIIYGTGRLQSYVEPNHVWDSASYDMLDQVCEPLWGYDLFDPDLPLIPILATSLGVWSNNDLTLTIPLKQDVTFHNGWPFNATAAKWNFDRVIYFVGDELGVNSELYRPVDYEPIINSCEILGDYEIALHLNYKLAFFRDLVSFAACYMIAPIDDWATRELEAGDDILIGTGPFTYGTFTSGESMIYPVYENYHGDGPAFETLIFREFSDDDTRNVAFLASEYHVNDAPNPEYYDDIDDSPDHVLFDGPDSASVDYLGMNCEAIPLYWRRIISYAYNYTYLIEEIMEGWATRLGSHIPKGIKYWNYDYDYATQKTKEVIRQMLVDDGHTSGAAYNTQGAIDRGYSTTDLADVTDDGAWENALIRAPIMTFNFTYNTDNNVRRDSGVMLQQYLGEIGITLNLIGITWDDYVSRLYGVRGHDHDELGIYHIGWIPDYNDPSNFVNPFWTPGTLGNTEQVNNTQLTTWMTEALQETDETAREALYDNIQQLVVEDIVPWVFLSVSANPDAWVGADDGSWGISGWPSNPFGRTYFKDVVYTPPAPTVAIPGYPIAMLITVFAVTVAAVTYRIKKRH